MKKIFLLTALVFQLTLVFGQSKGEGKTEWSSWHSAASCFPNLYISFISYGWAPSVKKYQYNFKIKNTSSKTIHFNLDIRFSSGEDYTADGSFDLSPGTEHTHESMYYNTKPIPNAKDFFQHLVTGYYENNGKTDWTVPAYSCDGSRQVCTSNCNNKTNVNNPTSSQTSNQNSSNETETRNQQTPPQNDPTFDRNNASYQDYYKRATAAGQAGNYDEAISLWNSAISVAVNDTQRDNAKAWLSEVEKAKANTTSNANLQKQQEVNRQQQIVKEQQRQQQLQQGISQLTTATVDLITYFKNRKNALKNSLNKEDGQALIDIVNSENPTDYTQNVIQIFTDLGYTYRKMEREKDGVYIILDNDVANGSDFILIVIRPAGVGPYDYFNRIVFSYHRKQKLREQLAVLEDNLKGSDGLELEGLSPSNAKKKAEQDLKNLNGKIKSAKLLIEYFDKKNYWNSLGKSVFSYAKDIAEAYEDKDALNNKSEAIRYYRKAASIPLDSLTSNGKGTKSWEAYQQKELGKVCFQLAYLLDEVEGKDGQEAIEMYKKSSSAYKTIQYTNIALIYKFGKGGVVQDWNLAEEYYEKAADKDDADAMYNLGKLYETGGPNFEKDESKSKKWFKKACKEDKKYCN